MPPLDLDYAPSLSPELICELERAARWIGLPLRELELLGQDPERAEAFVESVDKDKHDALLDTIDWHALEQKLYRTRTPTKAEDAWTLRTVPASS